MPRSVQAASKASGLCPYTEGQYYRPTYIPFFDTRTKQVTLDERNTYRVVQILADHVQEMYFFGDEAWSPSCRYFAYAVGPWKGNQTFIWDTVEQKQVGVFQRKTYSGLFSLIWSDNDNYLVVGTIVGQFLWIIPSNEQIQMNDHDGWVRYSWDTPRNQLLTFDSTYVVAYDLNTGKIVRKFADPFIPNFTYFDFTSDGKSLTIHDKNYDKWSVTWDRETGKIVNAQAELGRRPEEVQFSPDRRYLAIGGYGITIYDVSIVTALQADGGNWPWWPYASINAGYYSWRFVDASTLELTYTKDGKQRLYDLNTKKFR